MSGASDGASSSSKPHKPIICLVIGMAGSGKTTLMRQVIDHMTRNKLRPYVLNLDPAVLETNYEMNIDIRDTVKYKQVMQQYNLGPNGAIMTSLNLFATRIDQVITFVEQKQDVLDYVFVDTPGQIEVFTWSASGQFITEAFSASFPTCVLYVVDTVRCSSPITFMSNMSYACSIMYKTQLPFLLVFNKIDVASAAFAVEWMQDSDTFAEALQADASYSASLARSMSLMLEEFYRTLQAAQVSAVTGKGLPELFGAINRCGVEYETVFLPDLRRRQEAAKQRADIATEESLAKLTRDLALDREHRPPAKDPGQEDDDEEEGDEVDRDDRLEFEEFMREIQNNPRAGHPAGPKT